ncbi:sugar phosphate nucleotidyltransferase [Treponema socranskii]|uniref:sugar phosphate nucleotidyltransferase n=1 Tax=Treponema socranskii TaxID=53419 RepID=UPI002870CE7B|nr:sugar phosphate nucleotidyltransferase [Treponema socranskii]MDR9859868.1 sugar phosphate nucleotidyltransferase [Treponema socranskii]
MKLLVLMGGNRVLDSSNAYPLYLTEIKGRLILEVLLENYKVNDFSDAIFCIKQEEIDSFNVDAIIRSICPKAKMVILNGPTGGAVCTALLASEFIDNEESLLVVSVDDYIDYDVKTILQSFSAKNLDCGLVNFSSIHPRYSFIRRDDTNQICEITEKRPISKEALASFFYFKKGYDFVDCARNVIRKDNRIKGSFYLSQSINEMLLKQKKVESIQIDNEYFHSFKTERQLAAYISTLKNDKDIL